MSSEKYSAEKPKEEYKNIEDDEGQAMAAVSSHSQAHFDIT